MAQGDFLETDRAEIEHLRARLMEAEDALEVIRGGGVDAVIVGGPLGQQIYTITNADRPYRLLIEQMREGAVTLSKEGLVLYCNEAFASLLERSPGQISGKLFNEFLMQTDVQVFDSMLKSPDGGRAIVTMVAAGEAKVPANLSLSPLPDGSGGRIVCGVVTDLRPLQQSTRKLAEAGA